MHYYLVTGRERGAGCNPGWIFITAGIRHLIHLADSTAIFSEVDLIHDDPEGWLLAAKQADVVVVCGNPKFNMGKTAQYCDLGFWRRIEVLMDSGILVVNAFEGATYPMPLLELDEMLTKMQATDLNQQRIKYVSRCRFNIARDQLAEKLISPEGKVLLLPCSSWWAARELGVEQAKKTINVVVARRMPEHEWIAGELVEIQRQLSIELPTMLIVHEGVDRWWMERYCPGSNPVCVSDPVSLLRLFGQADKVVSLRVHASIPAASLGAHVLSLYSDSRKFTTDLFGIESMSFEAIKGGEASLKFSDRYIEPNPSDFIQLWRTSL